MMRYLSICSGIEAVVLLPGSNLAGRLSRNRFDDLEVPFLRNRTMTEVRSAALPETPLEAWINGAVA